MTIWSRIAQIFGGRRGTLAFYAVILAGSAAGLGLGVAEVYSRPPVDIGEERVHRTGLVSTVEVTVQNTSSEPQCPEVRIAARDREGLDLEEVVAEPETHTGPLAPGQTVTYEGVFRGLTPLDYREKLDEFTAYAFRSDPC
jgi:hypothetical protein